ncbi:983_t:CDS:2, partial [Ambispora gerdemannii]
MANEKPDVSSTFVPIDSLYAPEQINIAAHLALGYKFNISCMLYYDYKG